MRSMHSTARPADTHVPAVDLFGQHVLTPAVAPRVLRPIAPGAFAVISYGVNVGVVAATPLGFGWMAGPPSELVSPEPRHATAAEAATELLERLEEEAAAEYDEGPTCPSCDATVGVGALTCGCGAVVDDAFWHDHMAGATFEERMAFEVTLENEDRALHGAPLLGELGA